MAASIDEAGSSDPPVLEALTFAVNPTASTDGSKVFADLSKKSICLLCSSTFNVVQNRDEFLRHLVMQHKLVIADFREIADFHRYIDYWRERFQEKELTEFCSVIQTNSLQSDTDPQEQYFFLCDILPEDKQIRAQLQMQRLHEVLGEQQRERDDASFSRGCLFCRKNFEVHRADLFNHMATEHNFNVGHPDNLVYTSELLDVLQSKLRSMQCLYCEKTFKDRHVLKEHMRKKQHKKINPKNSIYDKFYIINYLEIGKNWEAIQSEDDRDLNETDGESVNDDDWSDWLEEEESGADAVCLFCDVTSHPEAILQHLREAHQFNLHELKVTLGLTFYQQVKLVNYIRRQMHQHVCFSCLHRFSSDVELASHLTERSHISRIPDSVVWDQPEYFFPTYENDNLLCALEDDDDCRVSDTSDYTSDSNVVIAEDIVVGSPVLQETDLLLELRS